VLAFYRGACLASLDRTAEAQVQFQAFLAFQPNAALDPAVYSKKVIKGLEDARRALASNKENKETPAEGGSLAMAYRAFPAPHREEQVSLGEEWANGPARFLLTAEERLNFTRLSDPVSRSEFVTAFWKKRDPKPETPENEFRAEYEKRVAFADSRFTQGETAGSLTDRGMVFILLGPPTYVGQKPLTSGEDANQKAGLSRYRPADLRIASSPGGTTADRVARIDKVTGPGTTMNEAAKNWREVWHYRREQLPKGIPYHQVDFDFVTKDGYGENVLQRETQVLDTLEKAKAILQHAA
jgi:GWxTD domain-containing protein